MDGIDNIKFVNAQQAKLIYYKNIKEKLHKTNAFIWFNKICKITTTPPGDGTRCAETYVGARNH
jgi:hypothetical protein